jgi:hypothetical protein
LGLKASELAASETFKVVTALLKESQATVWDTTGTKVSPRQNRVMSVVQLTASIGKEDGIITFTWRDKQELDSLLNMKAQS